MFDLVATGRGSSAVINKSGESGAPCGLPRLAQPVVVATHVGWL